MRILRSSRFAQSLAVGTVLAARLNGCGTASSICYCPVDPDASVDAAGTTLMTLPDGATGVFAISNTTACATPANDCRLVSGGGAGPLAPPTLA